MNFTKAIALNQLSQDDLKEIQSSLNKLGFDSGSVDGLFGPRTLDAWADFKESINQDDPEFIEQIGTSSYNALVKAVSEQKGKVHDFSNKQGTIAAIRYECDRQLLTLSSQKAYVLATVEHETDRTFKPIDEYGGSKTRYSPYWGRGYVQLTWQSNYQKYSQLLGVDLVKNPDLAKDPNIALFVLVHGFKTGAFTGKKLSDYVNASKKDFVNARRCINGTDKAQHIANLANRYL
jgi:predicted chitinase